MQKVIHLAKEPHPKGIIVHCGTTPKQREQFGHGVTGFPKETTCPKCKRIAAKLNRK